MGGGKRKGIKIHNRVRRIRKDTLEKLTLKVPYLCSSCCNDCKGIIRDDTCDCINYVRAIETNDLIDKLKYYNVDLDRFCKDYNLKKEFLMEMLKGRMYLKYKYYICLCKRLHIEGFDEFDKYKSFFDNYIDEENNNESEVSKK